MSWEPCSIRLNFRGQTHEAMQWYQEVFGGEPTMSRFAELHGSMDPSEAT